MGSVGSSQLLGNLVTLRGTIILIYLHFRLINLYYYGPSTVTMKHLKLAGQKAPEMREKCKGDINSHFLAMNWSLGIMPLYKFMHNEVYQASTQNYNE